MFSKLQMDHNSNNVKFKLYLFIYKMVLIKQKEICIFTIFQINHRVCMNIVWIFTLIQSNKKIEKLNFVFQIR